MAKSAVAEPESSLPVAKDISSSDLPLQAASTIAITIRSGTIILFILGIIVEGPTDINAARCGGLSVQTAAGSRMFHLYFNRSPFRLTRYV